MLGAVEELLPAHPCINESKTCHLVFLLCLSQLCDSFNGPNGLLAANTTKALDAEAMLGCMEVGGAAEVQNSGRSAVPCPCQDMRSCFFAVSFRA